LKKEVSKCLNKKLELGNSLRWSAVQQCVIDEAVDEWRKCQTPPERRTDGRTDAANRRLSVRPSLRWSLDTKRFRFACMHQLNAATLKPSCDVV